MTSGNWPGRPRRDEEGRVHRAASSICVEVAGELRVVGDVKAGAVSLKTHRHNGVQAGSATSNTPVP